MTNNIDETKRNNKKLWLILAGISTTVIGLTIGLTSLSANSSSPHPDSSETSQSKVTSDSDVKSPAIEEVKVSSSAKELVFHVKTTGSLSEQTSLEYEISDQNREVKGSGKEHNVEFDASVKVSASAYYRVKVRAIKDTGEKSDWSENYTVKLEDLEGMKTIQPKAAYYDTGWANGTDTSFTGAKEGIETAWGIKELSQSEAMRSCLPINSGDMTPQLLLPPLPSVIPQEVSLAYMTTNWNGSTISITYLWCQ